MCQHNDLSQSNQVNCFGSGFWLNSRSVRKKLRNHRQPHCHYRRPQPQPHPDYQHHRQEPEQQQAQHNLHRYGMSTVWKRLQRVHKNSFKVQFSISYQQLDLESTAKWVPNKLSIVLVGRSKRLMSQPQRWEPTLETPLRGIVLWTQPESHSFTVTLYRNQRTNEIDEKFCNFLIEDVASNGKRKKLAVTRLNVQKHLTTDGSKKEIYLDFVPITKKIVTARLECSLVCDSFQAEKDLDDDLLSVASLMSMTYRKKKLAKSEVNGKFDEINVIEKFADFTNTINNLTNNLTEINCNDSEIEKQPEPKTSQLSSKQLELKQRANEIFTQIEISDPYSDYCTEQLESLLEVEEPNDGSELLSVETGDIYDDDDIDFDRLETSTPVKPKLDLKLDLGTVKPLREQVLPESQPVPHTKEDKSSAVVLKSAEKLSTPSQDLLEWCQECLKDQQPSLVVENLTKSWRNGLAFCALIHKFHPELIPNFENLNAENIRENCNIAFEAGEILGVPKVIDPIEMEILTSNLLPAIRFLIRYGSSCLIFEIEKKLVPDKLAVMTYLFQLRTRLTGQVYELAKPASDKAELSSYTIGKFNTDNDTDLPAQLFEQEILSLRHSQSNRNIVNSDRINKTENETALLPHSQSENSLRKSVVVDANDNLVCQPIDTLNNHSPTKDNYNGVCDNTKIPLKSYILSRHDELKEKARVLIEQNKKDKSVPSSPVCDEERTSALRKKAKKIIAETRKSGSMKQQMFDDSPPNVFDNNSNLHSSGLNGVSEQNGNIYENPLLSNKVEKSSEYLANEYSALEKEQNVIDEQAVVLEKKLRSTMGEEDGNDPDVEEALMTQWFNLVNQRNALIRRQMQLNLLEKEDDLEKRHEMLNNELRSIIAVDECNKTDEIRRREALLLAELVQIVNKRNELVDNIDFQEKAIKDDGLIENQLWNNIDLQRRPNCTMQ